MFTEDLSLFFNTNDFAVQALFNGSNIINGILGNAYAEINGVESTRPAFTCALEDVAGVSHGNTLVIDGDTYHVVGVKPDGVGVMTLVLELQ